MCQTHDPASGDVEERIQRDTRRRCGEVVLAVVGRLGVAPAVPVCRWRPEKDWIGST